MRRRNSMLAVVALASLAFAGCGGGGDDDSTSSAPVATIPTTTALTKAELIDQGDAICAEVNAAIGSLAASGTDAESQTSEVADLYVGMVGSLEGLGTPQEAAGFAEFRAAADELSAVESELKLAVEREDSVAIGEAASAATPALEEFQAAADTYGFEDCSAGPSAPVAPSGEEEAPGGEVTPEEEVAPEEAAPEAAPEEEAAPEAGGAGGGVEGGGGGSGAPESGGGTTGGDSGGIGPG